MQLQTVVLDYPINNVESVRYQIGGKPMSSLQSAELLLEEFNTRVKKNKSYSLRAFARDLKISPTFCHQVLNKSRLLSEKKAHHITHNLNWSLTRKRVFVLVVRYEAAKTVEHKCDLLTEINKVDKNVLKSYNINIDVFKHLAQWHNLAVIELCRLENFKNDPQWIAKKLNISENESLATLKRLKHLGILQEQGDALKPSYENGVIQDLPSEWIRLHHRQVISRAINAITQQHFKERILSSVTFAVNTKNLTKAGELINKFRDEMMLLLETPPLDEVYQLSVQLYRVTEKEPADTF